VTRPVLAALALFLVSAVSGETKIVAHDYAAVDKLYWHRYDGDNLAQSLTQLDAMLAQAPDEPGLLWRKGRSLVRRGEKQEKKSDKLADYTAAQDLLKRAAEAAPNDVDARFWYGVAMGRYGEAKGVLKSLFLIKPIRQEMHAVIALDPNHGGAHRVLGEILWQVPGIAGGDKKKALEEYETAIRLDPRYTANYQVLAEAYVHFDRKDDAIKTLKAVADVKNPADPAQYPEDLADAGKLLEKLSR
jgi:tetratricopeptide (TPR) repeat protein